MTTNKILYWFTCYPVHVGVYGTQLWGNDDGSIEPTEYRYWDGEDWHDGAFTPDGALIKPVSSPRYFVPWAGLSEANEALK